MMIDDHEVKGEWHVGWEDGVCMHEDDRGNFIVERRVHRHPLGTEYTEVLESEP